MPDPCREAARKPGDEWRRHENDPVVGRRNQPGRLVQSLHRTPDPLTLLLRERPGCHRVVDPLFGPAGEEGLVLGGERILSLGHDVLLQSTTVRDINDGSYSLWITTT